jgi:hypothetical protein
MEILEALNLAIRFLLKGGKKEKEAAKTLQIYRTRFTEATIELNHKSKI